MICAALYLLELGLLKFVERTNGLIRFQKLAAWMSKYQKKYRQSTISSAKNVEFSSAVVSQENVIIQFAPDNADEAISKLISEQSKVAPKLGMESKESSFEMQTFEEQLAELRAQLAASRTENAKLQSKLPHEAPRNTKDVSFDSCAPVPPSDRDYFAPSIGRLSVDRIARSAPRDEEQALRARMNHVSVNDESVSPLSSPDHRSQQPRAFAVSPLRGLAPSQARQVIADFLADNDDLSASYIALT